MLLQNLRRVLESEALSRSELIGFFVALFIEEDSALQNHEITAEARKMLADVRPCDESTQRIWLSALDRVDEIYKPEQT